MDKKAEQKKIMELQKGLIDEILQYQIENGQDSVNWNCAVQFKQP